MAEPSLDERSIIAFHARTFHGFTLGLKWFCIHLAVILVTLIVAFAIGAGLAWGVVCGAIVAAVGVWAMNHGLAHSTERESIPWLKERQTRGG
jgi:hypothetical protein